MSADSRRKWRTKIETDMLRKKEIKKKKKKEEEEEEEKICWETILKISSWVQNKKEVHLDSGFYFFHLILKRKDIFSS